MCICTTSQLTFFIFFATIDRKVVFGTIVPICISATGFSRAILCNLLITNRVDFALLIVSGYALVSISAFAIFIVFSTFFNACCISALLARSTNRNEVCG